MARKSARKKKIDLWQVAFTRFMIIVAFLVLWMGGISIRLVHLQVNQHEWHQKQATAIRQREKKTRMMRGTIYDRNERALAMSVRARTLFADTAEIDDPAEVASGVARVLRTDANQLLRQLVDAKKANKRYVAIARKLEDEEVNRINKMLVDPNVKKPDLPAFPGLHWDEDQRRKYPHETLAAQVIGYTDAADEGRAGIEQSQDDVLHGAVIRRLQERDRLGRVYDEITDEREEPADVVLTIDAGLQYMAEQALEEGVRAASARGGMVVALSVKSGEILAMANYPTFDPNRFNEEVHEHINNRAVQGSYSPGSVFKVVTYGSALEKGLFHPDELIDSGNGTIEVAKHKFTDSHAIGRVSFSEAMAHSSNVCAIKTATRVGKEDFFAMMKKMGFGSRTGVELPAETPGILRPLERWYGDSLASMSIGYEVGVSALQMASAFATIASDGVRIQPRIIKEIRRSNSQPVEVPQTQSSKVLSSGAAKHLRTMLRQVVLTGTGKRAQLNGYTVAGKTGTAWKFNEKTRAIDSSKYISSFIGMAPASHPEIVIAVVMDEPKAGARDGGSVAAPVFREIAQKFLQELKVMPDAPITQETTVAENVPVVPEAVTPEGIRNAVETPAAKTPTQIPEKRPPSQGQERKKRVDKPGGPPGKGAASTGGKTGRIVGNSKIET